MTKAELIELGKQRRAAEVKKMSKQVDWTDEEITAVRVPRPQLTLAAVMAARATERAKVVAARCILQPLAGRDRTIDAALEALDGIFAKPLVW